jgi:VanZ family protein
MRHLRALPLLVVLALLLFIGLRSEPLPQVFGWQDKVHHALGFAGMVVALRIAFPRRGFGEIIAVTLAAALLIELGQCFQPHRSPSLADMLANAIGVLVGWTVFTVTQALRVRGR